MALELKVDSATVPDRKTSRRADHDAVLSEDLLGWAAYLMNAANSSARELLQAASMLIAAADSDVDSLTRRALGMPDETVAT